MTRKICIYCLTTSRFSSYLLTHPWFFSICSYLFIFARMFLHVSNVFFLLSIFPFSLFITFFFTFFFFLSFLFSVFGGIIHLMMVLLFLQCVCPNTFLHFSVPLCSPQECPKARNSVEIHYWMAVEKERPQGQARHVTREVGQFTASIHQRQMWKRAGASILPPGRGLRKEARCMEAHFFPLASPQSPVLLLTVCPKLIERKTTIFAVAFKCTK